MRKERLTMQSCLRAGDKAAAEEYRAKLASTPMPEERPEMKACALLLEWVEQGKQGMPSAETLADAVTFARLALK